jgi:hypothetical protein
MAGLLALRGAFGRFRERLARIRRTRAMRRLYEASPPPEKQSEILFWAPGGMPLMLHLEGSIAAALKLRRHNVHAIVCDGVFSACVKREITDQIPIEEWSKACRVCRRACSDTLTELGIEHSFIGDYVSQQELDDAKTASGAIAWDAIETLKYRNVSVGKNVKSAILRYLKGHDLPTDSRLVQEYAYSGLVCATAARNALDQRKPSSVFMSHGVYVDWGPALHTSLEMQVPITAWMASYLPARFYLRHVPDGVHIDFHNMSDPAWDEISSRALTAGQKERLDTYLMDRYQRNASFDMKRFKPYVGKTAETLARYRLDESKPVWGIMAHINWDTVSDYAPMLYDSFNEWMAETVEIAKDTPSVQWLVKVHPAEAWDNPESGVELLIRRRFPELPDNIRVLPAEENISPLDFYGLVDGAVTVYGTAGLEVAMHGKPVILAGEAHYGKKGFTLDASSRDEYRRLLHSAAEITALSESQVELAKKYAYCYFILRQVPVSVVASPDSRWWSFQFDKKERLLPGKDPAIDFLCERVLDGKDFIMSPQLEVEANNYMNAKT